MPSLTSPSDIIATALANKAPRIKITAQLQELPPALFELVEHLEILDLADNQLSQLPDDFGRFTKLRILFLSNNQFQHIPKVLADCPALEMIAFKNNRVSEFAEDTLPVNTRWLILTDNQITQLPDSIGKLHRLQKLALGGNQITELPDTMQQCKNLELTRLSANQLQALPDWLLGLPKLAWLGFAGNAMPRPKAPVTVPNISMSDIQLGKQIGEGASGFIYKANWSDQSEVAVKLFKGAITSDGYPQDELNCCLKAGEHPNLIKVLAQIDEGDQLGMLMELIPSNYRNLGLPPSLASCTRDTFADGTQFAPRDILSISTQMCDTLAHLHQQKVSHGDIYAHNTMINSHSNVLFGDFGAASDLSLLNNEQQLAMQKIEVRAFGCFMEDLLNTCGEEQLNTSLGQDLLGIKELSMHKTLTLRPSFAQILKHLDKLNAPT